MVYLICFRHSAIPCHNWIIDNEVRKRKVDSTCVFELFSISNPSYFLFRLFHFILQHCRSQNKNNLECYYLPWSKCTLQDALTSTNGEFIPYVKQPAFKNGDPAHYEQTILTGAVGENKLENDSRRTLCHYAYVLTSCTSYT
jgi:hypothetical protein